MKNKDLIKQKITDTIWEIENDFSFEEWELDRYFEWVFELIEELC